MTILRVRAAATVHFQPDAVAAAPLAGCAAAGCRVLGGDGDCDSEGGGSETIAATAAHELSHAAESVRRKLSRTITTGHAHGVFASRTRGECFVALKWLEQSRWRWELRSFE